MIKVIKQLLKRALGSDLNLVFEERLVLSYIFYAWIICFISIFINIQLGLGIGAIAIIIASTIFLFVIYIMGRFYGKIYLAKLFLSIYSLFFCNFYWYSNFGSRGSATYMFLVYFFIMIFAWENFQIRVIAMSLGLNILILFAIELLVPRLIPPYPTETARIIDSYTTLAIVLGFFAIIIINVKNNYVKQYKMAQKSDKLKSAFLANMSHEIRTPLNAIIGFSQLLAEKELNKEVKDRYSKIITENGDYLMKLISDILDISSIESGQLKIIINKVNLRKFYLSTFSIHKDLIELVHTKNIKLLLEIPEKPVYIQVDEMRLKQVVYNLIGNAIKFTSHGHIKIGYALGDENIIFFVEDTGCGIREEFQPEVFNRFVRNEDSKEVRLTRGTGIGLSLCKELVNILGGKIWFTSVFDEGTTFYFTLPQIYSPKTLYPLSKN